MEIYYGRNFWKHTNIHYLKRDLMDVIIYMQYLQS